MSCNDKDINWMMVLFFLRKPKDSLAMKIAGFLYEKPMTSGVLVEQEIGIASNISTNLKLMMIQGIVISLTPGVKRANIYALSEEGKAAFLYAKSCRNNIIKR